MRKIPVIAVVGPTASGKTSLAVKIASYIGGEVVSADSMQIYEKMNIATAKPTTAEMNGIPHHLIGFQPVNERFSVAQYVNMARRCISDIDSRGKISVLAGGTGMYVDSLLDNLIFTEEKSSDELREKLEKQFELAGGEEMLKRLSLIDSSSAEKLHPNDKARIIRAFEIYELTGKTKTTQNKLSRAEASPYEVLYVGINYKDRAVLYDRINTRVDLMLENGLLEEAKEFYNTDSKTTACQAIGYKELAPYFNNSLTLDECIDNLKKETRHYAKRQLTWFRRNDRINWIYPDAYSNSDDLYKDVFTLVDDFIRRNKNG